MMHQPALRAARQLQMPARGSTCTRCGCLMHRPVQMLAWCSTGRHTGLPSMLPLMPSSDTSCPHSSPLKLLAGISAILCNTFSPAARAGKHSTGAFAVHYPMVHSITGLFRLGSHRKRQQGARRWGAERYSAGAKEAGSIDISMRGT